MCREIPFRKDRKKHKCETKERAKEETSPGILSILIIGGFWVYSAKKNDPKISGNSTALMKTYAKRQPNCMWQRQQKTVGTLTFDLARSAKPISASIMLS